MNRIGVFTFYDPEGAVNEETIEYLAEVKKHLSHLTIAVSGEVNPEDLDKLNEHADEVLMRENVGLDAAAYKHGITHIGRERIREFDELIIFNNTVFLSGKSFQIMMDKMDGKADFWGITSGKRDYIPKHVQSYFVCFSKKVINEEPFFEFWENYNDKESNRDWVIGSFEVRLSSYLVENGYSMGAYLDYPDHDVYKEKDFFINAGSPVFKKNAVNEDLSKIEKPIPLTTMDEVLSRTREFGKIHLYGCTITTCYYAQVLKDKEVCFVITDEYYKESKVGNVEIKKFGEVTDTEDTLLIVCLGEKNRKGVQKAIEEKYRDYIYLY